VEAGTARIKDRFESATSNLVESLAAHGVTATQVSLAGLVVTFVGAAMIADGGFLLGPWVFAAGSTADALDGALARRTGTVSEWGAFIDSTLDRIGEAAGIAAIAAWFAMQGEIWGVVLAVTALLGGNLTSYVRARAEALGIECSEGWFGRPSRVTIFCLFLFLHLPLFMIHLLAIAACATAAQRIYIVHRAFVARKRAASASDYEETHS
jgi:CDP-diacylglycerol--glycerol-3-phosphate 3-phosphatidyltransferase